MKTAIIYGVTGQDGSYLSELLLSKDYTVYGVARRSSLPNTLRVNHLLTQKQFHMVQGDVTDPSSIYRLLNEVQPDEVYNLAAQSHVGTSFGQPQLTWCVTAQGCLNILEVIRSMGNRPRFYQASSSEMFGDQYSLSGGEKYQDEHTVFRPSSKPKRTCPTVRMSVTSWTSTGTPATRTPRSSSPFTGAGSRMAARPIATRT